MPKFVIGRELPGAGQLSPDRLQAISQKSCGVLSELGPAVQWIHSYVTDDKIALRTRARRSSPHRTTPAPTRRR